MYTLVLIRHAQSEWNKANLFTGWTDVHLSEQGRAEAHKAGKVLKEKEFTFDLCHTSFLRRAIHTLDIVLDEMNLVWLPVEKTWRLNERHYGALQGLNKAETAEEHGKEQVHIWRRSYATPPPLLSEDDPRVPWNDIRYAGIEKSNLPLGESLKNTVERMKPFIEETLLPQIQSGKKILISAHGNSLRALIKYLENISDEEIPQVEIPTGVPLVYELDENLQPLQKYYLDSEEITAFS